MKTISVFAASLLLSFSLVGCSKQRAAVPSTGPMIENLLHQALADAFTPGREVLVDLVEIPPNTTMDRHWHPGEEFHYYLEGEVDLVIDGSPPFKGTPGTVAHVPFRKMHTVITREKGGKVLVLRVHIKGEPVRYLEKDGTTGK